MKDDTILILGGLALGAFILYKPIQKTGEGIASAAEGIATGVQGIGSGVSSGVQGIGSGVGEIGQGVGSPFGYVDNWLEIQEMKTNLKYQAQQQQLEEMWKLQAQEQTTKEGTDLLQEQAKRQYEIDRTKEWEQYKTEVLDLVTVKPSEVTNSIKKAWDWGVGLFTQNKDQTTKLPTSEDQTPSMTIRDLENTKSPIMKEGYLMNLMGGVPESADPSSSITKVKRSSSSSSSSSSSKTAIDKYREQAQSSPELANNLKLLGWN